ncbi:laccase-15 isoform X3 [Aegilops tauschii subsp. strangulata]|nr:laccase-15 isoform X1 [Aegilops tauschii subsp. strangulata]
MAVGAALFFFFLAVALTAAPGGGGGDAALVEHTFVVSEIMLNHLCNDTPVIVVNGQLPGPAIEATEGDSVVVHVINKSPHGVTIHWHGVKQQLNCWADGAGMITQCPIQPNKNFTYRFNVIGQEGTLWWHAHVGFLRATVHGALIIRPRSGPGSYPFPKPDKEIPIVIGEWWDMEIVQVERRAASRIFDDWPRSPTINGKLGDLSNCSGFIEDNYVLNVEHGKTYLLRIVNAALHEQYNFKIAGHEFTVVAIDANYVKPYTTDTIVIASGETVDALLVAGAPPGRYYMIAQAMQSPEPFLQIPVLMSRGVVSYYPSKGSTDDTPIMAPEMPDQHDATTSFYFRGNLTSLLPQSVPANVDEQLFIAIDVGDICSHDGSHDNCMVTRLNNISFHLPTTTSLLQAHYNNNMSTSAISMLKEFPRCPPSSEFGYSPTSVGTAVRTVRYNTTVEIVFQNPYSSGMFSASNPMHLHGHDLFILGQGLGKFDPVKDVQAYNLVDPPVRNTALAPIYGWTAIRFVASNPGVWFLHCHMEKHVSSGMALALVVEDGPTPETTLPPPPADYRSCDGGQNNRALADE